LKLRYLKIADYPPLSDLALAFSTTSPLARKFSMHFVVGVNGTGKTHFLQALCEIFLALSDWRLPHFPSALVYELGARESTVRTVVLDAPGNRAASSLWLAEGFGFPSDTSTEDFTATILSLRASEDLPPHGLKPLVAPGTWPSGSSTPNLAALPKAVLAYTTGHLAPWHSLWQRTVAGEGLNLSFAESFSRPRNRAASRVD
jgi:AAA domain